MFRRWIEFASLYLVLPGMMAWLIKGKPFLLLLWLAAGLSAAALYRDPSFDRRLLSLKHAHGRVLGPLLARFAVLAAALILGVAWLHPESLFNFPRQRPELWVLVMLFYPVLSVCPQGIVYRALFFHRYAPLFPSPHIRLVVAAAVFSLGHLMFLNVWTLLLTFAGGLLFARTYMRTGSLLWSSLEHALYGCAMFTIGLGRLFYHGAVN